MPIFADKIIKAIKGKQVFKQLVILAEGVKIAEIKLEEEKGEFDLYEERLEDKYKSSFRTIMTYMNLVADNCSVPKEKFKNVTPEKETVQEYEFKAGDLRVFAIKIPNGQLVLLGGYKNQQKKDFVRFRALKKQYLESLTSKSNKK
jgi:hypothetical protein